MLSLSIQDSFEYTIAFFKSIDENNFVIEQVYHHREDGTTGINTGVYFIFGEHAYTEPCHVSKGSVPLAHMAGFRKSAPTLNYTLTQGGISGWGRRGKAYPALASIYFPKTELKLPVPGTLCLCRRIEGCSAL